MTTSTPHQTTGPNAELWVEFANRYPFALDAFQQQAACELLAGKNVMVCAPTGAGKTVVGHFAVWCALNQGGKVFYTTPMKALSNQTYTDLVREHGGDHVGLLTGDQSINGEAPVVVMTTEVLRNMLYADSPTLVGLQYVVLDEVHYLADPVRGAVWEEVLVHLDSEVQVAALSATVSNADEFAEWMTSVQGPSVVIRELTRPVPLHPQVLIGGQLVNVFVGKKRNINPKLKSMAVRARQRDESRQRPPARHRGGVGHIRSRPVSRPALVTTLRNAHLLPSIVFIFSRAGCAAALTQCLSTDIQLTTATEAATISEVAQQRCGHWSRAQAQALDYDAWLAGLRRGFAAHHAGLIPAYKTVVEDLLALGLVRVVFATETLALGMNVPARSVVVERLVKFNGFTHAELTPVELTQLTGRAGRRGKDTQGFAVIPWRSDMSVPTLAGLLTAHKQPLLSSFKPTYNMAINLLPSIGYTAARTVLEQSFAQFQADRSGSNRRKASIAKRFDKLRAVLTELDYLRGDQLTPAGAVLQGLYTEADLLLAQCLTSGAWKAVSAPVLVGCISAVIHTGRGEDTPPEVRHPECALALQQMNQPWSAVVSAEARHGVQITGDLDPSRADVLVAWACGASLETVLASGVPAGDFVRACRQIIDVLSQIMLVTLRHPDAVPHAQTLHRTAAAARVAVDRDIITDTYDDLDPEV